MYSFILLGLGNFFHVGLRSARILNWVDHDASIIGYSTMITGITVTIFYMIFLEIWRRHTNMDKDSLYYILQSMGIIRLIIMSFKANNWGDIGPPPMDWSIYRNLPFLGWH